MDYFDIIAHLQNTFTIFSKTSTGPVLEIIDNGCPANRLYIIPQTAPETRLSIADFENKLKSRFKNIYYNYKTNLL